MNRVRIGIDLELLRRRLSEEQSHELCGYELLQWLNRKGFLFAGDWVADREALVHLKPAEVLGLIRPDPQVSSEPPTPPRRRKAG